MCPEITSTILVSRFEVLNWIKFKKDGPILLRQQRVALPERVAFLTLIACRKVVKFKMLVIFKGCNSGLWSKREVINPSITGAWT